MASKKTAKRPRKPDKQHVWLSDELKSSLVAEAAFVPRPEELCKRYGVAPVTLERLRKRVADDAAFKEVVDRKKAELDGDWIGRAMIAQQALLTALEHHARLAMAMTEFSPDAMHKLAGAVKVLGDSMALRGFIPTNGQQLRDSRQSKAAPKAAAVGDKPAGGAQPAVGAGGSTAGAATPAATGGDPVH